MLAQHDWSGEECLYCSSPTAAEWHHIFCSERCTAVAMRHFSNFSRLAPYRYLTLKQTDWTNWDREEFRGFAFAIARVLGEVSEQDIAGKPPSFHTKWDERFRTVQREAGLRVWLSQLRADRVTSLSTRERSQAKRATTTTRRRKQSYTALCRQVSLLTSSGKPQRPSVQRRNLRAVQAGGGQTTEVSSRN